MFKKISWNWLESNFWKIWIYVFTNRRAYITLLGIYFLTFPDNTVKQIWFYTALGSLVSFLFEIPSGYFSDRFGYKKTLILAKIFMFLATLCFILGHNVFYFAVGSIFISLGFAFTSGTMASFFHENLEEVGKWAFFTKIWGRIKGSVSLFNALLIIAIPFLTKISFELPFYVWLWVDIVGLLIAFCLVEPKREMKIEKPKNIVAVVKETKWSNFWPVVIFAVILYWISSSTHSFRWPYLESIWYPVAYIWFVMWLSRFVWFLVSRFVHKIEERFTIKKLFFIEIFVFSVTMFFVAFLKNPYIVWLFLSLMIWYYWWRESFVQNYIINTLPDKKYKATMLSVKVQLSNLLNLFLVFLLWYIMNYSYTVWFAFLALLLFVWLSISWIFVKCIK